MGKTQKIVTIHQPDFLPWMGFFHRWAISDLLIILDDVQFIRRGWHHRDKIKTANGEKWLTIPVEKKGNYFQHINRIEISRSIDWKNKHLNLIRSAYGQAPCFKTVFAQLETIYSKPHSHLIDFNLELLTFVAGKLNIQTPVKFSSDFDIRKKGTEKLLNLVQKVEGTAYLSGMGSKNYLEENHFLDHGLSVLWHGFKTPDYLQLHQDFIPNLSILDTLMMLPGKAIISLLKNKTLEISKTTPRA